MSHTAEPWRLKHGTSYQAIAGDPKEPYTVANCWSGPFAPERYIAQANARRLVACVNACTGLSTESLENNVVAELVAACKDALQFVQNGVGYGYIHLPDAPDRAATFEARMEAVLAKAQGVQP